MSIKLCPFSREECLESKCKLWGDKECLFVDLLGNLPGVLKIEIHETTNEEDGTQSLLDDYYDDEWIPGSESDVEIEKAEDEVRKEVSEDNTSCMTTDESTETTGQENKETDEEEKRKEELLKRMIPDSGPSLRSHRRRRFPGEFDEIPKYLEKPTEEIAKEMAEFCNQVKPNLKNWHDFHNVRDLFWEEHDSRTYHLPAEYRMKVDEIENMAREILIDKKIPEFLRTSTIDELAAEMMKNPMKNSKWVFGNEWEDERLKTINIHDLPQELQDKIDKANERVKELLEEKRVKEMKQRTIELVPELIEWCKSKNLNKITSLYVFAFTYERDIDLSVDAMAYLEFLASQRFK